MTLASSDFSGQLKRPGSLASEANHRTLSTLPLRRTILVVETDQVISMIAITLQTAGYSVVLAESKESAIEHLTRNPFALALLDGSLPEADCLDQFQALRSVQPDLPVIAIFPRKEPGYAARASALGLSDYVTQPLDLNDLRFRIEVTLSKQALVSQADDLVSTSRSRIPLSSAEPAPPSGIALTVSSLLTLPLQPASLSEMELAPPRAAYLAIYCLGHFRVVVDGRLVCDDSTGGRRAMQLLKYLILNLGRRVRKERIADLLWPDLPGDLAANNLRGTIHSLRQTLASAGLDPNQFIRTERGSLSFDPGDDYYYDVEHFSRLLNQANIEERAGHWGEAITLYEAASGIYWGPYLELGETTEWVIYEQESLKERFMNALIRLADLYIETEKYEQAATIAQRVVREDWRREAAHRILMVALYKSGRRNQALIAYQNVVDTFKENLGIAPMQQTRDLAARILHEEQL